MERKEGIFTGIYEKVTEIVRSRRFDASVNNGSASLKLDCEKKMDGIDKGNQIKIITDQ